MRVNEESKAYITVTPLDENGRPFTPTSMRYRVDDKQTRTEIVPWTGLTPSTSVSIEVSATANVMTNSSAAEEVKVLTVQTDFDTVDQHSEEQEYTLVNLSFAEVAT